MRARSQASNPTDPIGRIFPSGRKIDLAFNLGSLHPTVRSTIIHEYDYPNRSMILAQTTPSMLPNLDYHKMEVTTLASQKNGDIIRVGVACNILTFDSDYRLSGGREEAALVVGYVPPLKKTNIRGAYRIRPNSAFSIMGKLFYNHTSYISGREFDIRDISATGIGLPVPKVISRRLNPLFHLDKGKQLECEILLEDTVKKIKKKIQTCIKVVRNQNFKNRGRGFIGGKYLGLDPRDGEHLFQFIHSAQTYEIRRMMQK